jgi:hypothetical protein
MNLGFVPGVDGAFPCFGIAIHYDALKKNGLARPVNASIGEEKRIRTLFFGINIICINILVVIGEQFIILMSDLI